MTNSPFYAAFERMWEHVLNKFDNYVKIENLDELSETLELIAVEDIDNICIGPVITFTIASTSYQAEEGMTWAEFANSSYNIDDPYSRVECTSFVYLSIGSIIVCNGTDVMPNDIIIPNHTYTIRKLF